MLLATLTTALCLGGGTDHLPGLRESLAARAVHAVAFVNDPMSHGQVGDGLLSLNEAIQLHNRTLTFGQLSQLEQWQVSGLGQDISWIDIDSTSTPVIAVERNLDPILDMPHGLLITGFNGPPVIDFRQVSRAFVATSNYVSFRDLIVEGGDIGVDLTQTDAIAGTTLERVAFAGQSAGGLRCRMASVGQNGRLLLQHCTFEDAPYGILVDETAADRTTLLYVANATMTSVASAVEVRLGSGGSGIYQFERLQVNAGTSGIRFTRPGGAASRAVTVDCTLLQIAAARPFDFAGFPGAPSRLTLRMLDLRASADAGPVLRIGPLGSDVAADIDDLKADGGLELLTGGTGQTTLANARVRNGAVTLGATATAQFQVLDSRFDGLEFRTAGSVPVTVAASCFDGGRLEATAQAPLQISGSFLGAAIGSHVSSVQPLPLAQLGSIDVVPQRPRLGGPIALRADLPPGFVCVFAMGATAQVPTILQRPIHVYIEPASIVTMPGLYRLQQSLAFTVPNDPLLAGTDWVVQALVLPEAGAQGPAISLPPGSRFVLH